MKTFAFCKVALSPLRAEERDASEMVSQILFGEPVEIVEKKEKWFKVLTYFDSYEGWVDAKHFILLSEKELKKSLTDLDFQEEFILELNTPWGKQWSYRGSYLANNQAQFTIGNFVFQKNIQNKESIKRWKDFALTYLNTPYLWGGKSPFGIDCSGFSQQVFRFRGINLPRDAYQQEEIGRNISFEEKEEGDLAFFTNSQGKITHVGIVLENNEIIHASSWVKIDNFEKDGIYCKNTLTKTHDLFRIKRI